MVQGAYNRANLAYERVYYSTKEDNLKSLALLKKAWSQKKNRQFQEAQKTLERLDIYTITQDSIKGLVQYELVLCSYLSEDYQQTDNYAKQFEVFFQDDALALQSSLIHIMALNKMGQWNEAAIIASKTKNRFSLSINTDSIYMFKEKFKLKKPEKAKMLSTFLPGTGQLYAGYPVKATTSVVLHTTSLGFGIFSVLDKYYLSGFLTGAGLLQAFYFGGIKHSGALAEKRNKKKVIDKSNELNNFLIKNIKKKTSK